MLMHRPTCLPRLPFLPTCLLFDPIEYTVLIRWTESPRGWGGICCLALAPPASIYNLCMFSGYFGGPHFENMDVICDTPSSSMDVFPKERGCDSVKLLLINRTPISDRCVVS